MFMKFHGTMSRELTDVHCSDRDISTEREAEDGGTAAEIFRS